MPLLHPSAQFVTPREVQPFAYQRPVAYRVQAH
jgi:hypothetical protein